MRWLRWVATIIFLFLSIIFVPVAFRAPIWQNVVPTLVVLVVFIWVVSGFFKKNKSKEVN